jgi:hypothetical protein
MNIFDCKENKNKTDVEIKNKVTNLGIKGSAEKPCSELGTIASALNKIQCDTCAIAKAVDQNISHRKLSFTNGRKVPQDK